MQLKHVVLPAPLGPMRPTISNRATCRPTSRRAWSPPKRIDRSTASRTGIDTLGARPTAGVHVESLTLEPAPDRRRDRSQPLGLEDHRENGEDPGQRGDDVDGVVLQEA